MAKNIVKNNNKSPLVSVVMSVYNGDKYLREAMDSILNQTFKYFEFIIIDDGSTDNTLKILKTYKDPRIVLISRKNKGLVESLNEGIKKARGKYVARMDADDISDKNRIYKQVELLENENKDAVFTFFEMVDDKNQTKNIFTSPQRNIDIYRALFIRNPLGHGTALFDKKVVNKMGGYKSNVGPVEDYDLWCRLYEKGIRFGVVPEALYKWRDNPEGISSSKNKIQYKSAVNIKNKLIGKNSVPLRNPFSFALSMIFDIRKIENKNIRRRYSREQFLNQIELAKLLINKHRFVNSFMTFIAAALMPYEIFRLIKEYFVYRIRHFIHSFRGLKNKVFKK